MKKVLNLFGYSKKGYGYIVPLDELKKENDIILIDPEESIKQFSMSAKLFDVNIDDLIFKGLSQEQQIVVIYHKRKDDDE